MAKIRRSISWAVHPFVVLISFLFSVIHLAPPAWTKTHGATDMPLGGFSGPEVTALIDELSENERFDHRLGEELRRLESGTQDLAQAAPETIQRTATVSDPAMTALPPAPYLGPAAPETMELAPLDKLAPPADVLLRQAPIVGTQQAPNADLGGRADPLQGGSDTLNPGLGIDTAPPMQAPSVKVQRVPTAQPQQILNVQPQQAICGYPNCSGAGSDPVTTKPVTKGQITR